MQPFSALGWRTCASVPHTAIIHETFCDTSRVPTVTPSDEVGFIHPSQLLMLKKEADAVFLSPDRREADVISSSEISGAEGVEGENAFSGIEITNWAFRLHVFFHCIKQQNTDSWRLL